jgi:nucleoside-diphosphate-sugar epimerase
MLIVGCGYIGQALGARAAKTGNPVTGVVSSAESAMSLEKAGIDSSVCNLDEPLERLPSLGDSEMFYFAPPPAAGESDPRIRQFLDLLAAGQHTPRIVYTSTSGVYGDCNGEWIDESRPTKATTDRARRRLDAEQALLEWSTKTGGEVVIVRVAGIYGPGRLPLERLRRGTPMIQESEAPWSNRIHAEDLVTVCEAAMAKGISREIYNVSDGTPGTMAEYFNLVADLAGQNRPPTVSRDEAERKFSPALMSFLRESRRLDNSKMVKKLGVTLKYPSLKGGVTDSL